MASLKNAVLCIGIFVAILEMSNAMTKESKAKLFEIMKPAKSECNEEFNTDMEKIKEAKERGEFDKIDTCYLACVLKKSGLMNKAGEFDRESAIAKMKEVIDGEDLKHAEEVVDDCVKVNEESVGDGEKGCERAVLLFKCFRNHMGKMHKSE